MDQTRPKIEFANTLRGVAAILVLISHYMGVFWTNRVAVSRYTQAPPLDERFATPIYVDWLHFHPWINWGALGVGLFFLISGFVIPFSLRDRTRRSFAISRAWRLAPTYAAGFSVTLLALYFGVKMNGRVWPYSKFDVLIHYVPGIRDHFETPIIDGIVWTLEIEVKFYLIMMLLLPLFRDRPRSILLVPLALVAFHHAYFNLPDLRVHLWVLDWVLRPFALAAPFLLIMWMGVTLHLRNIGSIGMELTAASLALEYVLFLYLWPSFGSEAETGSFMSYSAAIPIFLTAMAARDHFKPNAITGFFADISYPLYVVHAVAGYILMEHLLSLGFGAGWSITIVAVASTAIATLLHFAVEKPTHAIGRQLSRPSPKLEAIRTTGAIQNETQAPSCRHES